MTEQRLDGYVTNIRHYLSARRLTMALSTLEQLLAEIQAPWQMRQRLESLQQEYVLLSQYALDGAPDPHRREVYEGITAGIRDLVAAATREVELPNNYSLYYSTLRYERSRPEETIPALVEAVAKGADRLQLMQLADDASADALRPLRADLEKARTRLFNRIWVTYPIGVDDRETLSAMLSDATADTATQALTISALLLNLLHTYDRRAMCVLLHTYYNSGDEALRMRALVAYLIALSIHRERHPDKHLRALLATVAESPRWGDDVRLVFMQFIRTRDTEKITRQMRDEVIPQMLKLRPDIYKKISEASDAVADVADGEENPEWEELLEKSGLGEQMRKLQEMQEDGGDVMMSTFAHLKHYPFFNDPANWFLPFSATHTAVADGGEMARMLEATPLVCDSDKYSIVLSLKSIPESQKQLLRSQFDGQQEAIEEFRAHELNAEAEERRRLVAYYVQDLYRFFRLFRRKGEFADPFATTLNLATVPSLDDVIDDETHLAAIAEFYFKRGYYEDALALFRRLPDRDDVRTAALLQKMGFCLQKMGRTADAVELYLQAEVLDADSVWTLRRLGACYRLLGRSAEALPRYRRLCELRPDDLGAALQLGHAYMELGRYKDAMNQYFKVEYLDPNSTRALRPIAWCAFLSADYERSADYYGRIPEDQLTSADYLNMGHLAMASGRYRDAVDLYRKAMAAEGDDRTKFTQMMQADLHHLRRAGVDDLLTGIVLDSL